MSPIFALNKKTLQDLKSKLEKTKASIEQDLASFAEKDKTIPGDWDTRFPHWNGETGGAGLEKAADEVEEYSTLLPIEFSLEKRLQDINLALEKIKRGKYGKCEKCRKKIDIKRLKIYPEARTCSRCK